MYYENSSGVEVVDGAEPCGEGLDSVESQSIVEFHLFDSMVAEYEKTLNHLNEAFSFFQGEHWKAVCTYVIDVPRYGFFNIEDREKALSKLRVNMWVKALQLARCEFLMPGDEYRKWLDQITNGNVPEFNAENVSATVCDIVQRARELFCRKVVSVFMGLSPDHITNSPEGFRGKLIIANVVTWAFSGVYIDCWNACELVFCSAVLMGESLAGKKAGLNHETWQNCRALLRNGLKQAKAGKWIDLSPDISVKCFLNGNAHFRISERLAELLNGCLAEAYPDCVTTSAGWKKYQKNEKKEWFYVRKSFSAGAARPYGDGNRFCFNGEIGYEVADIFAASGLGRRLSKLDPELDGKKGEVWEFRYDFSRVLESIKQCGGLIERRSYQFYNTPDDLAGKVVAAAGIQPWHRVLEPSAGMGAILLKMPVCKAVAVDVYRPFIEALHQVKRAGLPFPAMSDARLVCMDFHEFAARETPGSYDRIVMNPPFSEGRAASHVLAAFGLLAMDGIMVAIVPEGFSLPKGLLGQEHTFSEVFHDRFEECGIGVRFLKVRKVRLLGRTE